MKLSAAFFWTVTVVAFMWTILTMSWGASLISLTSALVASYLTPKNDYKDEDNRA